MYKLLIVDDEPLVAKALGRAMARHGFDVALARHAPDALARMEDFAPDIVISGFNMPGMNGPELLRQVEIRFPRAVRIILSGCAEPHAPIATCAEDGSYRLVRKPWDNKQLAALLLDLLRQRDCHSGGQLM